MAQTGENSTRRISTAPSKHKQFFLNTITIRVENTLFSVPSATLTSHSEALGALITTGKTEDDYVLLEGLKSCDFESLLTILLPQPTDFPDGPSLSKDGWEGVLKLASMWEMSTVCLPDTVAVGIQLTQAQIRQIAIDKLTGMQLGTLEKMSLGKSYKVPHWVLGAIEALAGNFHGYSIERVASVIGWEKTARLLSARDSTAPYRDTGDYLHKTRITCWSCKNALPSAKIIHCPCGKRYDNDFCFRVSPEVPTTAEQRDVLELLKDIFQDELEAL